MNEQRKRDVVFLRSLVRRGFLWSQVAFITRWSDEHIRELFLHIAQEKSK